MCHSGSGDRLRFSLQKAGPGEQSSDHLAEHCRALRDRSIALHWVTLVLLVAVYASMELRGYFPRGSATREAMKTAHFTLGLLVFALVWVRLALRLSGPTPEVVPTPAAWMRWLATIVHLALYALLIAMPVIGWVALSAAGKPVPFFGIELPALVTPDKAFAGDVGELHETISVIGYYLIALHAAAALAHHYFWRDNTLVRILPARRA